MVTTNSANVKITNSTGSTMRSVAVVHKYSDVHKERYLYEGILSGSTTAGDRVQFNTGFLTTGRDWWIVTWYNADYTRQYYTDPDNFRNAIDAMEKVAPAALSAAVAVASEVGAGVVSLNPGAAIVAGTLAGEVASQASDALFNDESTAGFKQHILREEDANQDVNITIHENGQVTIQSPSGTSETKYSSQAV